MEDPKPSLLRRVMPKNRGPRVLTAAAVLLTVVLLYSLYAYIQGVVAARQPIAFSHRMHAGLQAIRCRFCHPYVGRSNWPGIPPVGKCLYCHKYIAANRPQIKKVRHYFDTNTPIRWKKVFYLQEHVLFNHQRHIRKEIACRQCHGKVQAADRLARRGFQMGSCLQCHRRRGADIDCWLACHS